MVDEGTPVKTSNDNERDLRMEIPEVLNLLPLRDTVVFPVLIVPIAVGRESSIKLIDDSVVGGNRIIGVVAMKDPTVESPTMDDIYRVGTAVVIRMMGKMPDGIRLIAQGISRIEILEAVQTQPYLRVRVRVVPEPSQISEEDSLEIEALRRNIAASFQRVVQLSPNMPDELEGIALNVTEPHVLTDLVAAHLPLSIADKQKILETFDLKERMRLLMQMLAREVEVLELGSKLQSEVHSELSKTQREYYLREQLKAIQKELGEMDENMAQIEELRQKIAEAKMPPEAEKEALRELDRLSRIPSASPEYTVARTYIETMVALPWSISTEDNLDISQVRQVLDEDHYGLEKVKERILEYLAVRKFKTEGTMRQPILCLVGPPGVGKTSLGRSIARALGRKFVRISLGGIRDEAEIRGHRRTYIGALPGQIIQGIRRAGSNNPVFMLDEIDKVGADFRGDPSAALLEALDPEQNSQFRDHYLDVPFDLSKVLFITTANVLDTILPPLRDRMEVIEIPGYTEDEKVEIAKRHLIPRQMQEHGLNEQEHIEWTEEGIRAIIRGYTREAGVRNLEREIASVCRKVARRFAEGETEKVVVDAAKVEEFLGAPRFEFEEISERTSQPGVAVGLVWTPVGGDIVFVEATLMPGSKGLLLTGQLGDVMRESAQTALSYIRSHAKELGIDPNFFEKHDVHIHVPAGAIPKDGPSAGITMATALASLLTGRCVKPRLAMTGEITLSGRVLPVGGIKEKVLAAHRAGIETVILPSRNRKDLIEDVPQQVREQMHFVFVDTIDEVLKEALVVSTGTARRRARRKTEEREVSVVAT
ncbi:MAG: Lon protease [Armatimonadota bacterium]|nr:MAG: Lon protease [Armatimonadota bacterium]